MGLDKDRFVLSVGALNPRKGFDFITRSLAQVAPADRPDLVIASNFSLDAERQYLSALAAQLNVRTTLLERVSDDELVNLYNRASFTVYAPVMEPFGLVPLESMACGTPVIGVREAGVRETVRDRETGLLVDRDEGQFAQAIQELVRDDSLTRDLGERGRQYVTKKWTWDVSVSRLEGFLKATAGVDCGRDNNW